MIPHHRMSAALAILAMQSYAMSAAAPSTISYADERLNALEREQRMLAAHERRHQRKTGTSLLDKARRAKGRL